MLNEELMILICKEIDEKLSRLIRLTNKHGDYSKAQCEHKEVHEHLKGYFVDEISKKLGVGMDDVARFYDNPDFQVQLNSPNYENNSIAGCIFASPAESIIRIMNPNYDVLGFDEERRKKAEECDLKMIIKTTRTKMFGNTYAVTEKILNIPSKTIAQTTDEYFSTNSTEILNNDSISELTPEEQREASDKAKKYIWEKFKEYNFASTTFNNTLVNSWSDYKKFFKETYGETFKEKDDNRLSLWQDEGYKLYDNRRIDHNGETVTLEDQYKLSLLKK